MNSNLLGSVGIVIAGFALLYSFTHQSVKTVEVQVPAPGSVVSSQGLSSPVCTDNNCSYIKPVPFTAATSTPIDILSPNATSSLKRAICQTTQSTSTALTLRVATSTIFNATTTNITTFALTGQGSFVYIPAASASIYAPKTHFVLGIEGVGYLTTTLVGSCTPEWQVFGTQQ